MVGPLPTTNELMEDQASAVLWQIIKDVLKKDGTTTVDEDGLLRRKTPADGIVQIIVPERYRRALRYHEHCLTFAGHPETRRMYNVFRKNILLAPRGL